MKIFIKNQILTVVIIMLSLLLFIGGPGHYSDRIFRTVWDLGHIFLFLILVIFLFKTPLITNRSFIIQILVVAGIVIFFSIITELLQFITHRTPELADIRRDLVGAAIGFFVVFHNNKTLSKISIYMVVISAGLFIYELIPLIKTLTDEYELINTEPILSSMEGTFEEERWKGNSDYYISSDFVSEGNNSLKVILSMEEYCGITLKYMYRDWSNKKNLHFSVYYPEADSLLLYIRINDFIHLQNNRYDDRYNKEIFLKQGWNEINISIYDIKNAPDNREMNLKRMQSIGMFVMNLPREKTIYIDNVYLN